MFACLGEHSSGSHQSSSPFVFPAHRFHTELHWKKGLPGWVTCENSRTTLCWLLGSGTLAPFGAASMATFSHLGHFHIFFPFPGTLSPTSPPFAWLNPIQLSGLSALTVPLVGSQVTVPVSSLDPEPYAQCLSTISKRLQTPLGRNRVHLGSWVGSECARKEGMIIGGLLKEAVHSRRKHFLSICRAPGSIWSAEGTQSSDLGPDCTCSQLRRWRWTSNP